jgi:hypothetical protein
MIKRISPDPLVSLANRFNTVAAMYHDAYAQWQVKLDPTRRTFDDCRFTGWGWTLEEACDAAESQVLKPPTS